MSSAPEIREQSGRFKKGVSGNPGGRPRGIQATLNQCTSPAERIAALVRVADDPKAKDHVRANELILAYFWGKPPATAAPDGYDPLELDEVAAEISRIVLELDQKRAQRQAEAA